MPSSSSHNRSSPKGFLSRTADSLSLETAQFMSNTSVLPSGLPTTIVSASPSSSGKYFRYQRGDLRSPHDTSHHDPSGAARSPTIKPSAPSQFFTPLGPPHRYHTSTRYDSNREITSSHPRRSGLDDLSNQLSSALNISEHTPSAPPPNSPYLVHTQETQSHSANVQRRDIGVSSPSPVRILRHQSVLASGGPSVLSEFSQASRSSMQSNTPPSIYTPHSPSTPIPSSSFPSSPASSTTEVSSIGTQRSKQRGKRNKDRKQSKLADTPVTPPAAVPMSSVNLFMPGYSMSFAAHGRSSIEPLKVSAPQKQSSFSPSQRATSSRSPRSSLSSADASGSWRRSESTSESPSSVSSTTRPGLHSAVEPPITLSTTRPRFLGIAFGKKKIQTMPAPTSPLGRTPPTDHQQSNCYPSKSYDSILLDHDRRTGELLRRLNPTAYPAFHDFGGSPPSSALDLGCGQGHWLLEAALFWKRTGTRITGFDMVDVTKDMWPSAVKQGVAGSIMFVQGNFLRQKLPFPDKSFDFVRMANLTLCIPKVEWESVLLEVRRVLTVGGRLELIDDQIFFPYGKVPTQGTSFPSSSHSNPSRNDRTSHSTRPPTSYASTSNPPSKTDSQWFQQAAASKEIEDQFEHMLFNDFGISIRLSEFVPDLLMRVFGQARELSTMHLMLAPPNPGHGGSFRGGSTTSYGHAPDVLAQSPGLVLWPSTFIPISPAELEVHATKHPCILLATEDLLVEHGTKASNLHGDILLEALRKYEGYSTDFVHFDFDLTCRPRFIRRRFDALPDATSTARHHGIQGVRYTPSPQSPVSGTDLTHVRTFHVYVATKMNAGSLGESI
ncbi:hypothetical protein BDZ94DRAFT_808269 [Collybia nuda]|uniref:Methyltransferase domain-containing protein n=1 Tax=Collybia nuda TaxID=64659 RepID=A0A9P5Y571_9AGAR|nr:hypothetical protein BDZ94DRAFT_808269 [Collybia nuda]